MWTWQIWSSFHLDDSDEACYSEWHCGFLLRFLMFRRVFFFRLLFGSLFWRVFFRTRRRSRKRSSRRSQPLRVSPTPPTRMTESAEAKNKVDAAQKCATLATPHFQFIQRYIEDIVVLKDCFCLKVFGWIRKCDFLKNNSYCRNLQRSTHTNHTHTCRYLSEHHVEEVIADAIREVCGAAFSAGQSSGWMLAPGRSFMRSQATHMPFCLSRFWSMWDA